MNPQSDCTTPTKKQTKALRQAQMCADPVKRRLEQSSDTVQRHSARINQTVQEHEQSSTVIYVLVQDRRRLPMEFLHVPSATALLRT